MLERGSGGRVPVRGDVSVTVPARGLKMIALVPRGETPVDRNGITRCGETEIWKTPDIR